MERTNEPEKAPHAKGAWLQWAAPIISAISVIIMGYFAYNQVAYDKRVDYELEVLRAQQVQSANIEAQNAALINQRLSMLLHEVEGSRAHIIQPHPSPKHEYLSTTFEIDQAGVSTINSRLQNISMRDIPNITGAFAQNEYIYVPDLETSDTIDALLKSIFMAAGTKEVVFVKLVDANGTWIGNLVIGNTSREKKLGVIPKLTLKTHAEAVQFWLPTFRGN